MTVGKTYDLTRGMKEMSVRVRNVSRSTTYRTSSSVGTRG